MVRHTLKHSKKPLLIAGHGIRIAKAQKELQRVLDMGIPVATTFNGFDLVPSDHPNFVGRIGTLGTYGGNYALKNCDLLLCVGTRNNIRQVSYNWGSFAPQAKKIMVDIDLAELCKPTAKGETLLMDAKEFLKGLAGMDYLCDWDWLHELRTYDLVHPVKLTKPYRFIYDLTSKLPEGSVVVAGNGTACVALFQAGIVKKGQRIFWNSGCAAMGYALPAAIGAHFATGKEVICITGDGSLQMNIQELQTIKHHRLPIKIFVLNNGGYRSLEMTQAKYFNGDFIGCNKESGVSFPDFCDLAELYDMRYWLYTGKDSINHHLSYKGAALCEVMIGNDYFFRPKFTNSL